MSLTYSIKKCLENFRDTDFNGLYIAHKFYEPCLSNLITVPLICSTIYYHISLAMLLVMNILSSSKESFLQKDYKLLPYMNELIKSNRNRAAYAETLKNLRLHMGIKRSSCFKTFWQARENFTDWNIINQIESDVYHMHSNISNCVSNRNSHNLCPFFYQDNFQLVAQENVPKNSVKNLFFFQLLTIRKYVLLLHKRWLHTC